MSIQLETLIEAAAKDTLILIDGGFCLFNIRRDGQLTVSIIMSTRPGAGSEMLEIMKKKKALFILAKCPADLPSNAWYEKKGFERIRQERTKTTKRLLNVWKLNLHNVGLFAKN